MPSRSKGGLGLPQTHSRLPGWKQIWSPPFAKSSWWRTIRRLSMARCSSRIEKSICGCRKVPKFILSGNGDASTGATVSTIICSSQWTISSGSPYRKPRKNRCLLLRRCPRVHSPEGLARRKILPGLGFAAIRIVRGLREGDNAVQEADQILPGQVVGDQRHRGKNRQCSCHDDGKGKVQKAGDQETQRCQKKRQQRAMQADVQLPARAQGDECDVPQSPQVRHDGHGKHDYALDGNRKVIDIAQDTVASHYAQQDHRGHGDSRQIGSNISVLIHRNLLRHKWYSNAGIVPGKRRRTALRMAARAQSNQGTFLAEAGCSSSLRSICGHRSRRSSVSFIGAIACFSSSLISRSFSSLIILQRPPVPMG